MAAVLLSFGIWAASPTLAPEPPASVRSCIRQKQPLMEVDDVTPAVHQTITAIAGIALGRWERESTLVVFSRNSGTSPDSHSTRETLPNPAALPLSPASNILPSGCEVAERVEPAGKGQPRLLLSY